MDDHISTGQPAVTGELAPAPTGPRYLGSVERSAEVPLQHPFALEGVEYRVVRVRRLVGYEAKAYVQKCVDAVKTGQHEPFFPGIELPAEAYGAHDDDDIFKIDQVVDGFFPDRFRALDSLANRFEASDSSVPGGPSPAG